MHSRPFRLNAHMIDRKFIGLELPPRVIEVEKGAIRSFARAIGDLDPVFTDESAARAAGYRSLVAPPTFAFCLNMMASDQFTFMRMLGVDPRRVLHGEQSFTYHATICAGDVLTFHLKCADIYERKGGALEFVVHETRVTDADGGRMVDLRGVIVVQHGQRTRSPSSVAEPR